MAGGCGSMTARRFRASCSCCTPGANGSFCPQGLGFGSGMRCWRRLRDWYEAEVRRQLQQVLLDKLRGADQLDFSRAVVDASHVRAMRGGPNGAESGRPSPAGLESTT